MVKVSYFDGKVKATSKTSNYFYLKSTKKIIEMCSETRSLAQTHSHVCYASNYVKVGFQTSLNKLIFSYF